MGQPVPDGDNFIVTFSVTVENTGTVDLENLSLTEDLAEQFGSAFVGAGELFLTSDPTTAPSQIVLASDFDGSAGTELLDPTFNNILSIGDSFTFEFMVAVNSQAGGQQLVNQIVGTGDAIDEDGNAIVDSSGAVLIAQDASDNGFDANSGNGNASSSDATPVVIPLVDFEIPDDGDGDTTAGSPPVLIGIPPLVTSSISNFLGSPGPIYSGIPTNTTNPVTLDSNRPITGGFSVTNDDFGGSIQEVECCGEIVDAVPGQPVPVETVPVEQVIEGDCGCEAPVQGVIRRAASSGGTLRGSNAGMLRRADRFR